MSDSTLTGLRKRLTGDLLAPLQDEHKAVLARLRELETERRNLEEQAEWLEQVIRTLPERASESPEQKKLVLAIDHLEDVLARYFSNKDVPMEIQQAVSGLEEAMIAAGLSPLAVSGSPREGEDMSTKYTLSPKSSSGDRRVTDKQLREAATAAASFTEPFTVAQLQERIGFGDRAASEAVRQLREQGILVDVGYAPKRPGQRGRPFKLYTVIPQEADAFLA